SDETVGKLIAEAMDKVGKEGVITVEDGTGLQDELDVVEGMQFSDETVGKLIAEAMDKVGKEGVITVEDGTGLQDELDVVEGMQF
ncbi:hypothetical protein ONJ87_27145, partial [Salmonella enterica subsp. enterica serovar Anatum]|nr:hypothetical protein [Salmonella enterica subsp. enterica serovar Anatum]